jgi:hypothetical protein
MTALCLSLLAPPAFAAEMDGFLHTEKGVQFPIGFYAMPDDDARLKELADSGVNLVRCRDRKDLDRCRAAGLMGWMPIPVQEGWTEALKAQVLDLRDHPALAVWEGPDEIVWNFTQYSGLAKTAGITSDDWMSQKPKAVAYARREAETILPRMCAAIEEVRKLDPRGRPVWINEAGSSDLIYVRRYMDSIDVTGCDYYPIKAEKRDPVSIGKVTDRWLMTGRDRKPVWMVLQAFSWHKIRPERYPREAYPTFDETRFMAWDAIAHGARGVLYWGAEFIDRPEFRTSILAMTAELAAVGPLLFWPEGVPQLEPGVRLIEADVDGKTKRGVRALFRGSGDDALVVLVNEDDTRHMGVEVRGLEVLSRNPQNSLTLQLLYGDESFTITDEGVLLTRMQPYEVKVFATSRKWESPRRAGRDFR